MVCGGVGQVPEKTKHPVSLMLGMSCTASASSTPAGLQCNFAPAAAFSRLSRHIDQSGRSMRGRRSIIVYWPWYMLLYFIFVIYILSHLLCKHLF